MPDSTLVGRRSKVAAPKSLTDRMKITAQIKGLGRQDEAGMMA
jgi:hypothetical protein